VVKERASSDGPMSQETRESAQPVPFRQALQSDVTLLVCKNVTKTHKSQSKLELGFLANVKSVQPADPDRPVKAASAGVGEQSI
jgi:hypothetical protein